MKTDIKVLRSDIETLRKNALRKMEEIREKDYKEYCADIWRSHLDVNKLKNRALGILQDLISSKTILDNDEYKLLFGNNTYGDLDLVTLNDYIEKYTSVFVLLESYVKEIDYIIVDTRSRTKGYNIKSESVDEALVMMNIAKRLTKTLNEPNLVE